MGDISPGAFWDEYLGAKHPNGVYWIAGGGAMFAVDAETIRKRPKEQYVKLLRFFEERNHNNPEEGHFMERLWLGMFSEEYRCEKLPSEKETAETLWIC